MKLLVILFTILLLICGAFAVSQKPSWGDLNTSQTFPTDLTFGNHNITDVNWISTNEFRSVKSEGAVGDGVADDTIALVNTFQRGGNIYIPNGIYNFNPTYTLSPSNDSSIVFGPNATIKLLPHDIGSYDIIEILRKKNVKIYNVNLDGNRDENSATTGMYGHGIYVRESSNITISGGLIENCWGDGIYLGGASSLSTETNHDITISGVVANNNRRHGVTIISADGVMLESCELSNSHGLTPSDGIDIEPNYANNTIDNIVIRNSKISGNNGYGVDIGLTTIDDFSHDVYIKVENTEFVNDSMRLASMGNISGYLDIIDCRWENSSRSSFIGMKTNESRFKILMHNPTFINPLPGQSVIDCYISAASSGSSTYAYGGITIINPRFFTSIDPPTWYIYIKDEGASAPDVRNVTIINPIGDMKCYVDPIVVYGDPNIPVVLDDSSHMLYSHDDQSLRTLNGVPFAHISNRDFTTGRTISLGSAPTGAVVQGVVENASCFLVFDPANANYIIPTSGSACIGCYIKSVSLGSSITLRKINAAYWFIEQQTGSWTYESG